MPKRIVIVDDTMSVGRYLEAALKTLGPDILVSVVPSGEEAILEVGSYTVDVVVTDINLPGISGVDLAQKLSVRYPDVKVVFISGMSDFPLAQKAEESGAVAYFKKPLDTEIFLEEARKWLEMSPVVVDKAAAAAASEEQAQVPKEPPTTAAETRLIDSLTRLRQRLGAQATLLLDERGRVVVQAGDFPDQDFESRWVAPLLGLLSASRKVARLVGSDSSNANVHLYQGQRFNLVFAPVGLLAVVVVLEEDERQSLRLALAFEETLAVQRELSAILVDMGIKVGVVEEEHSPADADLQADEEQVVEDEIALAGVDLEALFTETPQDVVLDDVEDFWESALDENKVGPTDPDALSFDQAQKLGLAPDNLS